MGQSGESEESWAELRAALAPELCAALGDEGAACTLARLIPPKPVADDTAKLVLRDASGSARAVLLLSAEVGPEAVARQLERAAAARRALGEPLAAPVLAPLAAGAFRGRSWALVPYYRERAASGPRAWRQHRQLRRWLLPWLRELTARTAHAVAEGDLPSRFVQPLEHLRDLEGTAPPARAAAAAALSRLESGRWRPKYVLMHGDLWPENVLIDPSAPPPGFVLIDWGGAQTDGYPLEDLVSVANSMRLGWHTLLPELRGHTSLLGAELADAASYLAARMGHLALHLEHFPLDRFHAKVRYAFEKIRRLPDA